MKILTVFVSLVFATKAIAADPNLEDLVGDHIMFGYETLVESAVALDTAAQTNCLPESVELRSAYQSAFDAWMGVSHLRFGPSEVEQRAFALAFWPDPRGSTPKTLASLMRDEDTVVDEPEDFATVSVAARGFYALEFLLYDDQFIGTEKVEYRCRLIQAIAHDILRNASAILSDWANEYAALLAAPNNETYRTREEALRQLFTALATGLEFTSLQRLERPMGTFDRPRPNRAEARRSGRSLRNVVLSLEASQELARYFVGQGSKIDLAFDDAINTALELDDPTFAGVADISGRLRVESLKLKIDDIRKDLAFEVGETLGIAAGFNALDGD
ncbi:MAG: imelysin family protein [Pseudomonadota bacterium]